MTRIRASKWSDEEILTAVAESKSFSEVRRRLGAGEGGSAWRNMKKQVELLGADVSHFDPYASRKRSRKANEDVFVRTDEVPNMGLVRKRYLASRDYICDECGLRDWRGQPVRLHMDHIDGDRRDNRQENLRLLCPNCHDQTETWGRVKGEKHPAETCECGSEKSRYAQRCRTCDAARPERRATKIEWPPVEVVKAMIEETNVLQVGKSLGVSDNAVRKFLKRSDP